MPINYPSNPSDGDTFTHGGVTYTWDASPGYWKGQFSVPTIPEDVSDLTDTTNLFFDGVFSSLTGKPTTLAGYGITDGGGGITGIGTTSTPDNGSSTTVNAGSTAANKNIAIFSSNFPGNVRFVTANSAGSFTVTGISASDPVKWYYVW